MKNLETVRYHHGLAERHLARYSARLAWWMPGTNQKPEDLDQMRRDMNDARRQINFAIAALDEEE